jgi:hypothetical protein
MTKQALARFGCGLSVLVIEKAAVFGSVVPADRPAAFLSNGPPMIDFVMKYTPLGFRWMAGYPDYYPELPGGMPNGRSIEPAGCGPGCCPPGRRSG